MNKAQWIKTLVLVAVVLFFTLQRGSGFLLLMVLPIFLVYALYHLARMLRRPGERRNRGIRLGIWCGSLALVAAIHLVRGAAARDDAELAVEKVAALRERAGAYPATLREVGLDDTVLKDKRGIRYSLKDGRPVLSYPAPFMWMVMYEYDFEARKWRENAY